MDHEQSDPRLALEAITGTPTGTPKPKQQIGKYVSACFNWSGRQDSNLRPLAPHASALPGCATPRPRDRMIAQMGFENSSAACPTMPQSQTALSGEES